MSNIRVMHENFVDSDYYQGMTYSTQKTAMPASNVENYVRRTKVWRTDGYWEITSANRGLVFDVGGSPATANVAIANYTSDSTFFAAIKAAIEAENGSITATVSRDTTTNKIKITVTGVGTFNLRTTNASSTLASVIGFSTAVDRTGALTYTADTLKIHTSEWMRWDFGTAVNPKAFILIGLRNTPIKISQTATITLQGNSTDSWSSPEYAETLSYNENAIIAFSETGLHTQALRYWRLKIVDASNEFGYLEISNIYLGDLISPTRGSVQFPLKWSLVDLSEISSSRSGVSYADEIQQTKETDLAWSGLTSSEAESLEDFAIEVGRSKPFFISLDPDGNFASSVARQVRYVRHSADPTFNFVSPNYFTSDWSIREEL